MGATHKETVTELVKAMITSGMIKPKDPNNNVEKDILKKSIFLVEYGVRIFRDPKTQEIVDNVIFNEHIKANKKGDLENLKITKDINNFPKGTKKIKEVI